MDTSCPTHVSRARAAGHPCCHPHSMFLSIGRETVRYVLVFVFIAAIPIGAGQNGPAFEVASIKRNTEPLAAGPVPRQNTPKGTIRLVRLPVRLLVLRAFPLELSPPQIVGLPGWVDTEYYDVTVQGRPDASAADVQQMWRTLLADRMHLAAHYETRERPTYDLLFARTDRSLGPGLKPSSLDCSAQDVSARPTDLAGMKAFVMGRCSASFSDPADSTFYAGGLQFTDLVESLRMLAALNEVDRPHHRQDGSRRRVPGHTAGQPPIAPAH